MAAAPTRYGAVAQALHWLQALLVFALLALGWYMTGLPLGLAKLEVYAWHKTIGLAVLGLALLRLAWRAGHPPPPLPAGMADWERRAAKVSHALLYIVLIAQPLVGMVYSWATGLPLQLVGGWVLPSPIPASPPLAEALKATHGLLALLLTALIVVHVAAALRHHFLLRDDVLRRMLPGRGAARVPAPAPEGRS